MNTKATPAARKYRVILPILLLIAAALGWSLATYFQAPRHEAEKTGHIHESPGEATIWTCSMHPQIKQPNPGLCPICAMDLIPMTGDDGDDSLGPRQLAVSESAKALMEIETAEVERRFVESELRLVGKVAHDETSLAYITAWVPGRIERMYADYTGTVVKEGDHMVDLYSPDLINAKEELRRASETLAKLPANAPDILRNTAQSTLDATRSRLRRWGMTEAQVRSAMQGSVTDRVTIYAPIGGTVIARNGQEGMYVDTGERIYTIANLDKLWVMLEAYESDLSWLHFGQRVEFTTEAQPGRRFEGIIAFIDPVLDERTRTVAIRINAENPDGLLKPGMFVRATVRALVATGGRVMDPGLAGKWISPMHPEIVKDAPGTCDVCGMALVPAEELGYVPAEAKEEDKPLVIPVTAPLITGRRAVVYVEVSGAERPTYEGREIVLGPRAGGHYMIVSGLQEGERVVVQGNFKIDSALEIQAKPSMMGMESGGSFTALPPDPELQQHLRDIFNLYTDLSEALAHDELDEANMALEKLKNAPVFESAKEEIKDMKNILQPLKGSEDPEELREGLLKISNEYVPLVRQYGMAPGSAVYRMNCPMVGGNVGGDWLQADESIRNPYMGKRMFVCGTVEEQLVAPATAESTENPGSARRPQGGHDHGSL